MNLSVETKVAIAVATGFVVMVVGAMAKGSEGGHSSTCFLLSPLSYTITLRTKFESSAHKGGSIDLWLITMVVVVAVTQQS